MRYPLHVLLLLAAFGISWASQRGTRAQRVWLVLPEFLAEHTGTDLHLCIAGLTVAAALCAVAGAFLRTWGVACLGRDTVWSGMLRGDRLVTGGPYGYLRNPIYVGTVLHTLALTVLFSWVGAVFAVVTIGALQMVLVTVEERFLTETFGGQYSSYSEQVGRFLPRFGRKMGAGQTKTAWPQAYLSEVYVWGAAITFAAFGARYNALFIAQGLLISLGLAIAAQGISQRR